MRLTGLIVAGNRYGKNFFSRKPPKLNLEGLRLAPLEHDLVQIHRYTPEEIKSAYNTYAQSPFINFYLREGGTLSEQSQKIVGSLTQAINDSQPLKGRFLRGITGNRRLAVNEDTIRNLVFNNRGFTSTAPMENARYAETFALGSNSAVVEFDLSEKALKAYKPNNYEVIFAPNAFTPDKFDIIKTGEKYYKVIPK